MIFSLYACVLISSSHQDNSHVGLGFLKRPHYSLFIFLEILSPCLFNLYTEYIMRNAGLEETQAGIKIAGRNINNLRYADDTTLMAESEEEL